MSVIELVVLLALIPVASAATVAVAHIWKASFECALDAAKALGLSARRHLRAVELTGNVDGRWLHVVVGPQRVAVRVARLTTGERLAFEVSRDLSRALEAQPFSVDGSVPGVARALFATEELRRLLEGERAYLLQGVSLSAAGELEVRRVTEPGPDIVAEVREALAIAAALERLVDIEALPDERRALPPRGAGSATGAPVGVPSVDGR